MIVINKNKYSGNNISIRNNRVIVDGNDVTPETKEIIINVEGNLENLDVEYANKITITGDVGEVRTSSGDIEVSGVIKGNISTSSGDVECDGDVGGHINTSSGDVKCGNVNGNVKTMSGNIKYKK